MHPERTRESHATIPEIVSRLQQAHLESSRALHDCAYAAAVIVTDLPAFWETRIRRALHNRAPRRDWAWPVSLVPEAVAALKDPTEQRVVAAVQLLRAHSLFKRIVRKGKLKPWLERMNLAEVPFALAALGQILGRQRALGLDPRASGFSEVELRIAAKLWAIAGAASAELTSLLSDRRIAKPCRNCDELMPSMTRTYCSKRCLRAFHNAQNYQRHH